MQKFSYIALVLLGLHISGCDPDTNPLEADDGIRSVRYSSIITPVDSLEVFRSFTYTNEFGGKSQSGVNNGPGTFTSTVELKKGTVVELTATGNSNQNTLIGGRVEIYVDDSLLVESYGDPRRNNNTITVSARIP